MCVVWVGVGGRAGGRAGLRACACVCAPNRKSNIFKCATPTEQDPTHNRHRQHTVQENKTRDNKEESSTFHGKHLAGKDLLAAALLRDLFNRYDLHAGSVLSESRMNIFITSVGGHKERYERAIIRTDLFVGNASGRANHSILPSSDHCTQNLA